MKHLPNLLTLANLFCGCVAIAYFLTAQPYTSMSLGEAGMPTWQWVFGAEQMYMGSFFIGIAAICDVLDGFTARALKVFSPIGKDLDSLADVVSFGVAPSVVLYKFLWDALMSEKNAFDVNMLGMAPAFVLACFAALRLAKFNITASGQKAYFIGMPVPAVGIFVCSFPLLTWFSPRPIAQFVSSFLQHKWYIYGLIAVLCWLMVSNIKFMKMIPGRWSFSAAWPQYVLALASVAAFLFLGFGMLPFAFVLYVLLSLVNKYPEPSGGDI